MTHICVRKLTIFGSEKGLSPERRQAIIWTNVGNFVNSRPQCVKWFPLLLSSVILPFAYSYHSQIFVSCVPCHRVIEGGSYASKSTVHLCLSKSFLTLSLHSVLLYFDENYLLLQVIALSVYCFHVLCRIKHFQVQVQVNGRAMKGPL